MTKYCLVILLTYLSSGLHAQLFTPSQLRASINQLKTEQQLIKQNNNLSNEKKLELLTDYGLLKEASTLLNSIKNNYEGEYAKAKFFNTIHQYKRALQHVEVALTLSPEKRDALLLKAELLLILNQPIAAQEIAETRLAKVSFDDRALVINAKAARKLKSGNEIAKSYIKNALAINNNNADAWFLKAEMEAFNGDAAMEALKKCLSLNPYHLQGREFLGYINNGLNNLENIDTTSALLNWELALLKNPFYAPVHEAALQVHLNQEKKDDLIKVNNTLSADYQQQKLVDAYKYIDDIKRVRKTFFANNLQTDVLSAFSTIQKEQIPASVYHTILLEIIYAHQAIDNKGVDNINNIIKGAQKNRKFYHQNKEINSIINISLGEFSTFWELLLLNQNDPEIQFYSLQDNDLAFYELLKAISDNAGLKASLIDKIYENCMPENLKRKYRQLNVDCDLFQNEGFGFQYYYFNQKIRSRITSCDSLNLYFTDLVNGIKEGGTNLNLFKAEALTNLSERLIKIGKFNEATSFVQTALTLQPRHIPALLVQSKLKAAQNQHEEAQLWWSTAFETDPTIPEIYITEAALVQYKFELGRITAETAFNEYSKAYAKAISLEKDPYLFSLYNRQIQEQFKLFGKYDESLQLAEAYLSKKVRNHNIFEASLIEETKAFTTALRVEIGNANKFKMNALNLLETNPYNTNIHDKLYSAYAYNDQEELIVNKIGKLSYLINNLYTLKQTNSKNNPIFPEVTEFLKPLDQLTYLAIIVALIDNGHIEEAKEKLQSFSFSKLPEVWSNYHYTRAKLLIAEENYLNAGYALVASLESMPANFRSFKLLEEIYTKTKEKTLKKAFKKQKKLQKKLNFSSGEDLQ